MPYVNRYRLISIATPITTRGFDATMKICEEQTVRTLWVYSPRLVSSSRASLISCLVKEGKRDSNTLYSFWEGSGWQNVRIRWFPTALITCMVPAKWLYWGSNEDPETSCLIIVFCHTLYHFVLPFWGPELIQKPALETLYLTLYSTMCPTSSHMSRSLRISSYNDLRSEYSLAYR